MRFLGKRSAVELVQMLPEVSVELLQTEVVHLLHVVKESLFQDANGILHGTLVLGFLNFGRQDNRVVVLSPFCVILVQLRGDPVPVGNNGLLAVVADDQRRNAAEVCQGIVVDGNPLRLLGGDHSLGINVLGIRKNCYEDNDLHYLTGKRIYHLKGFPGKIHFHLLANDGIEMQSLLIFLAPLGVVLTELPIRVEL